MKILVTGAMGNIGSHTVSMLIDKGHEVTCFDKKSKYNSMMAMSFPRNATILWGDIRDINKIDSQLSKQDVVIHLAAILPPATEKNPELATEINLNATKKLVNMLQSFPQPPLFIFSSSNSVHGLQTADTIVKASDPLIAIDHYTSQKIACEELIRQSRLNWVILRVSAVVPLTINRVDKTLFDIPLHTKIEFTHPDDAALAIVNCIGNKAVIGKAFLIGGGPSCQMIYKDFMKKLLNCSGIGMFPENLFSKKPYYLNWMDTTESQQLLHYQQHDLSDLLNDLSKTIGWRKIVIKLFRPFIRFFLINQIKG